MKKLLFIVVVAFSSSLIYADYAESVAMLSSKVILQNANGYFVLSDRSCWKVVGFSKRWRSLGEWWNSVELVPPEYECVPSDWCLGAEIEVYSKYQNLHVFEENAANCEELKRCTHLLVNARTGQILFAAALEPAECIIQIFEAAHREGYKKGYDIGYEDGRRFGYQQGAAPGLDTR